MSPEETLKELPRLARGRLRHLDQQGEEDDYVQTCQHQTNEWKDKQTVKGEGDADVLGMLVDFGVASLACL